jgi:RNA polymerase sigma-70 factor (ECF subfamily)
MAAKGGQSAFAELVHRHQGAVRGAAWRLTGGGAAADDIAQAAFLTAWRRIDTFSGGTFRAWVCAIAYREYLQARRKQKPEIEFEETAHIIQFDHAAADYADRLDLSKALLDLPEPQRVCVTLSVAGGLSHRETAQATGWPLGTVKSHINRGIAALRKALSNPDVA